MAYPLTSTAIFIDADLTWQAFALRKIWQNQRKMPGLRNHGILHVTQALSEPLRMDMYVCNNGKTLRSARRPNLTKKPTVKFNDATIKAIGINIVVKQKFADRPYAGMVTPK